MTIAALLVLALLLPAGPCRADDLGSDGFLRDPDDASPACLQGWGAAKTQGCRDLAVQALLGYHNGPSIGTKRAQFEVFQKAMTELKKLAAAGAPSEPARGPTKVVTRGMLGALGPEFPPANASLPEFIDQMNRSMAAEYISSPPGAADPAAKPRPKPKAPAPVPGKTGAGTGAFARFASDLSGKIGAIGTTVTGGSDAVVHIVRALANEQNAGADSKPRPAAFKAAADDFAAQGDPASAKRLLDSASAAVKSPDDPGAPKSSDYSAVAKQFIEGGDNAAARKALDRAVALGPADPEALSLRAQTRLASGDKAGALADARAALAHDPENRLARLISGHADDLSRAGAKPRLGFGAAGEAGDLAGAGGALAAGASGRAPSGSGVSAAAAGAAPAGPRAGALTAAELAMLQKARGMMGLGDLTGAALEASRAIDANPKNAAAWLLRAELNNRLENWAGALRDAEEALKLDPANAAALRERAYANIQLGDYAAALSDLEQAMALDPGNGLGYLYRALALERLGRLDEAERDYLKAAALDPSLKALSDAGLKRLRALPRGRTGHRLSDRLLFYGGFGSLALALFLLGLLGTERGRDITTSARSWLTGRGRPAAGGAPEPAGEEVEPGAMVGGNYRITRELGRGGMGVVYEAEDLVLARRVAAKRLIRDGRTTDADLERFIAEARLVASLKHPHLAEIYAVVTEPDVFLVFEFVDGVPLDRELASLGAADPSAARGALADVCAALDYAHARRIIHRDLKPSNVMRARDGACKVMDFGIAHRSQNLGSFTKTAGAGTPPYMAPEQALGSVSKASDFFALAVMAYEMLAGRRPYAGPDFLDQKLRQEFTPASRARPGLPAAFDAFFARGLAADPTRRFQSGAEFMAAFDAALVPPPQR